MYSRCKVCDKTYRFNFIAQFPDENYCPRCEQEIIICLMEMEELDEEREDNEESTD